MREACREGEECRLRGAAGRERQKEA